MNGFQKELLLVTEGGVKAGRGDPHGFGEIAYGSGLVAVSPEEQHCLMQRGFAIKAKRASGLAGLAAYGCFRLFHN